MRIRVSESESTSSLLGQINRSYGRKNKQLKAALKLAAKDFVEQIGYGTVDFWVKYWMEGEG
jgi:hypothetical protein